MKTDILTGKLQFNSLKPCDLSNFTKSDIISYFNNTFEIYESLFTSIRDDSYFYLCPDRLRLPLIFYYGHTAAVYVNKMVLSGLIRPNERINLDLETIFETGVDEMSWDDTMNYRMGGAYKWPSIPETKDFRLKVKELINKVIERTPLKLPVEWDEPLWALFMGFEHERIHLETSSVLIHQLPIDMVQAPEGWTYGPFKIETNVPYHNEMIELPATDVRLGKDIDFPSFGWDNEYGRVDCKVSEFEASKYKITNEEFLEFIEAGGYEKREYWTTEGWDWLGFRKSRHPLMWICPYGCKSGCGASLENYTHCQEKHFTKEELNNFDEYIKDKSTRHIQGKFPYKLRLMFDVVDMPTNFPVEVVYHEAKAFCKWKGDDYRLLSEAEHHAIRDQEEFNLDSSTDVIYQQDEKFNHNFKYGSSTPVNLYPANTKGFHDVFGNVWEWCEDHFNGLPGFKTSYLYDDFSTPCFDGRHNIIMGGSWISTGDEASRFARFMFRRHFLQHCGFRLARSKHSKDIKSNPQIRLVSNQVFILGAGFQENPIVLDKSKITLNYYQTCNTQYLYDSNIKELNREIQREYNKNIQTLSDIILLQLKSIFQMNRIPMEKALHIGTSTGKITFELANLFEKVVGLDFCGQFLDVCMKLQLNKKFETKKYKINLNPTQNVNNICFKQMTWLSNEVPSSDLVLFTMLDRVMNPMSWLKRLKEIVNKNGVLIIVSKYTADKLNKSIGNEFQLIEDATLVEANVFSMWKLI